MGEVAQCFGKDSKVVVTGASGFIGQCLVQALVTQRCIVRAISRSRPKVADSEGVEWFPLDIVRDVDRIAEALADVDIVYHLAGGGAPNWNATQASELFNLNVVGTINVLEAARNRPSMRVVVASSAAVYGTTDSASIDENRPLEPASTYGLAKLAQEQACELYSRLYGLDTIALRLFNVYGATEDVSASNSKLIPTIVRRMTAGQEIQVFGDGQQRRDFVHVRDVAGAFIHAGGMEGPRHQVFNIGTGVGVTVTEVISCISNHLGITPNIAFKPAREGETLQSIAGVDRAHAHGFRTPTSFAEGIAEYGVDIAIGKCIAAYPTDSAKNE